MIFSFGILVQILKLNCRDFKNNEIIDSLVYSFPESVNYSPLERSTYSKIPFCKEKLPTWIRKDAESIVKNPKAIDVRKIANNIENSLSMKTNADGRSKIAQAIIWCFTNESFKAGDKIFYWSGKTREEVISQTIITDFWEFLAETMIYCCQLNNCCKENIGYNISEHINDINSIEKVTILENSKRIVPTLQMKDIDAVFSHVTSRSIEDSQIRINFHILENDGDAFDYAKLKAFLSKVLKRYVFSMVKTNELQERGYDVSQQASMEIIKNILSNSYNFQKELGDILAFSFCEGMMDCPKILTNYEIDRNRIKTGHVSNYGIHFGKVNDISHFIITSSSIKSALIDAIHDSIEKAKLIAKDKKSIIGLISPSLLQQTVDDTTAKELAAFIISGSDVHTNYGYVFFIGYSFNRLSESFQSQIESDIKECIKYIKDEISTDQRIANRDTDIYLVPFDDAEVDSEEIIKDILGIPKE